MNNLVQYSRNERRHVSRRLYDSDVTHYNNCVFTRSAKLIYVTIKLWQYKVLHSLVNSAFDSRIPRRGITLNNYIHASNFIIVLNVYVNAVPLLILYC